MGQFSKVLLAIVKYTQYLEVPWTVDQAYAVSRW